MALEAPGQAQAVRRASIPYRLQRVTAVLGRLARNARAAQAVTWQTALEQLPQNLLALYQQRGQTQQVRTVLVTVKLTNSLPRLSLTNAKCDGMEKVCVVGKAQEDTGVLP